MVSVETINLTKTFGRKAAVDEFNLTVERGEIFALLGPNGSGKSTLIKMLTGVSKPTSGDAFILGKSILTEIDEIKKLVGVLPESLGLFQELTIWEHLNLTGDVHDLPKKETVYRAEQLLKAVDLWELRETKAGESSYGMKKKCSLAMALIHNPQIVFADEPFEGVDPISARSIKEIFALLAKKGCTVFITSHIIDVMEKIIDSFAVVSEGKILRQMDLETIRAQNRTLEEIYFSLVGKNLAGDLAWLER